MAEFDKIYEQTLFHEKKKTSQQFTVAFNHFLLITLINKFYQNIKTCGSEYWFKYQRKQKKFSFICYLSVSTFSLPGQYTTWQHTVNYLGI